MEHSVKQRLFELCAAIGLTPNQFSIEIGHNRDYLRKITKEIGSDKLRQIHRLYPQVNLTWLITGEGNMFISEEEK
ncbi:hypothetical protein D0T50_09840 [Bacteroides sp. 214]|uniref:hypothetical protein n=1 Tax=Bacteroides sp. 214 TaxID=2302935 RepID=UPI0013CF65A5|nr:hypothetical protein [Bacteroides sp. 214]NDW13194.1 hypothetical protein [Bacteroides sp. 214]